MPILTCSGIPRDCTTRNQVVQANPDIAGIGVILGFLSTACLAFLIAFTIIFLDRYDAIATFFLRVFTKRRTPYTHNDVQTPYWRHPSFWSLVLRKNLLALSDTQLLTGIAIQFTAMLQHCSLSIYHFQIIIELAFLTTVTHLLTVVSLRNYFVKNRWINLPRIVFMLGNLGVLGYTSFVAYSYDLAGTDYATKLDNSASLACFFQRDRPRLGAAFGGKWAALLIGAIGGHATVIAAMYLLPEEEERAKGEWSWKWFGAMLRTWVVAPTYAVYGIVSAGQVLSRTQALGTPDVTINGKEEEVWGFGQFLPVLLLGLPVFAGWESFWEEYDLSHIKKKAMEWDANVTTQNLNLGEAQDTAVEEKTVQSSGPSSTAMPKPVPMRATSSAFTMTDTETAVSLSPQIEPPEPAASPQSRQRTSGGE
ncbi:hypothetical protein K505DRAFT_362330 [Melanomma pulvis-pyrius CBS 109.77]|uniref:Uncharacterized protein n=1 Tax=Melanomma pulvis-pyrius CBS 109.77 TaxID=1314802 RepID=A0A6A6X9I5_9PLEO|nr:hypothetical protein K505DRAFT_362330 [Melanomma pulvis-pyrius CBS 109.77]